jgi:predicted nucleotidyltransferase
MAKNMKMIWWIEEAYIYSEKLAIDPRIIDNRTKQPIIQVLDETGHTPHPVIIQYIKQRYCEYLRDRDELKKHLSEIHEFEVYAISQLYDSNFV